MHQVYWDMTEPTPYAIVFEVLWRLRNGVPTDELLAGTEVRGQIKECGLLDRDLLLVAEEEMVNGVRLADVEGAQRYYALTKEGVLIHMQKAPTQGS